MRALDFVSPSRALKKENMDVVCVIASVARASICMPNDNEMTGASHLNMC